MVGSPAGRHLMFLHRLEQRRLRLGRGAVDLVGQHDVGEDRPLDEAEGAPARGQVFLDDLRAGDVGRHEVGRELDPIEGEVERLRDGRDHERLGQSGHPDQEGMSTTKDSGKDAFDDVFLTHDPPGHLGPETGNGIEQPLKLLNIIVRSGLRGCHRCPSLRGMRKIRRPLLGCYYDGVFRACEIFHKQIG